MKQTVKYVFLLLTTIIILPPTVYAQKPDSLKTINKAKNLVSVEEGNHHTRVTFPGGDVEVNEFNDTITKITIGHRRYDFIESPGSHTRIQMVRIPRTEFKGHWVGFDLGLSNFFSSPFDSNLPAENQWLDLNSGKSVSVGMNLFQHSTGLQKHQTNLGIVTGLGWTINNYRFDSPNILQRGDDGETTYFVSSHTVEKNKLVTSFLTIPVLLEWQLPNNNDGRKVFVSGGIYGGFRLGSHIKVVYNDGGQREKEKSREDLNLNSFKYGAMVRAGFKWLKLYAKCDLTPLFESGRGPEVYPWTVGVTLIQF